MIYNFAEKKNSFEHFKKNIYIYNCKIYIYDFFEKNLRDFVPLIVICMARF